MDYASRETRRRHFAHIRPHRNSPESTRNSYLLISQINFSSPESHEIPWNRLRSPSAASISWTSFWHLHVFRVTSPIPNPQPEGSPLGFPGSPGGALGPRAPAPGAHDGSFPAGSQSCTDDGTLEPLRSLKPRSYGSYGLLLWCGTMGLDKNNK